MSGKRAAQALLELDTHLAAFAASLPAHGWGSEHTDSIVEFVRNEVMNTWTLTLAAQCAGVSEQQVVAALFHLEPLRIGSTCVCQGVAANLFNPVAA